MLFFSGVRRWRARRRHQSDGRTVLRYRVGLLQAFIILAFSVLTAQLWRLQIVEGSAYRERAEANRLRLVSTAATRGVVYDRNGRLLVENQPSLTAAAVVADIPRDAEQDIAATLETVLHVPAEKLLDLMEQRRASGHVFTPVALKTGLDRPTAFIIEERHWELPGISVLVEPRRHYLDDGMLSHVLGHIGRISAEEHARLESHGYDLNDTLGKAGVELSYETELRGTPGRQQLEVDASGRPRRVIASQEPVAGANLVLSIDTELQAELLQALRAHMGNSQHAAAVALRPKTGEVLAMATTPTYDDNIFGGPGNEEAVQRLLNDTDRPLVNYATSGVYAPGSIFKMVTGTAALQEGIVTPNTVIGSLGSIFVSSQYDPGVRYEFKEWNGGGLGRLNFYQAVALSSDVYFYYLSGGFQGFRGLGVERLARYARMYGLGSVTGIDLPGEAAGLVPDEAWKLENLKEPWLIGDTYNMGMGQGYVLVTPLQMARAVSAVANGGELLQPQVVRELRDSAGNVVRPFVKHVQSHLAISDANLHAFAEGMRLATISGTARNSRVPGVTVAAKTGTAEFGTPTANRVYDTHGWWMGFAPLEDPEIAMAIFVERGTGSFSADPIAGEILRWYFARERSP